MLRSRNFSIRVLEFILSNAFDISISVAVMWLAAKSSSCEHHL